MHFLPKQWKMIHSLVHMDVLESEQGVLKKKKVTQLRNFFNDCLKESLWVNLRRSTYYI